MLKSSSPSSLSSKFWYIFCLNEMLVFKINTARFTRQALEWVRSFGARMTLEYWNLTLAFEIISDNEFLVRNIWNTRAPELWCPTLFCLFSLLPTCLCWQCSDKIRKHLGHINTYKKTKKMGPRRQKSGIPNVPDWLWEIFIKIFTDAIRRRDPVAAVRMIWESFLMSSST